MRKYTQWHIFQFGSGSGSWRWLFFCSLTVTDFLSAEKCITHRMIILQYKCIWSHYRNSFLKNPDKTCFYSLIEPLPGLPHLDHANTRSDNLDSGFSRIQLNIQWYDAVKSKICLCVSREQRQPEPRRRRRPMTWSLLPPPLYHLPVLQAQRLYTAHSLWTGAAAATLTPVSCA